MWELTIDRGTGRHTTVTDSSGLSEATVFALGVLMLPQQSEEFLELRSTLFSMFKAMVFLGDNGGALLQSSLSSGDLLRLTTCA